MDTILVWNCPHCSKPHLYAVEVRRSHWMGNMYHPARPLEFTRLFTCPSTNQDFQISMHLMQPHGVDYEHIAVSDLVQLALDLDKIQTTTDFYDEHGLMKQFKEHRIDPSEMKVPPGGIEYEGLRILGIYGIPK